MSITSNDDILTVKYENGSVEFSEETGEMYFDSFSFGMTDKIAYEDGDVEGNNDKDNSQQESTKNEDDQKEDSKAKLPCRIRVYHNVSRFHRHFSHT